MPELPPKAFGKLARTIGSGTPGPPGKVHRPCFGDGPTAPADPGPAYAELQVTSNFSFLRGASHPDELVLTGAALGHRAIAITDRNSLAGIVRAHHAAKTVGIRLVVGVRLDLKDGTSLLAYPEDRAAYGRLTRLLTLGKRRAPKGECWLDWADVVAHGEGQIVVVLPSEDDAALAQLTARVTADFSGRAYLAAHYLYRGDDARRLARLAAIAEANRLPLVATGEVLYHIPERRPLQDVLTCIREHCTIGEAGFRLAANAERHLKPPAEMTRLFRGYEDALARTVEIANRVHFSLEELKYEYPEEPVPAGMTPQQWLTELTWRGAAERLGCVGDGASFETAAEFILGARGARTPGQPSQDEEALVDGGKIPPHPEEAPKGPSRRTHGADPASIPARLRQLIEHELALIEQLDFARYFLTVHDIVRFARSQDILCQGRGSAANSVVCYCLGITSVDPARIDVLFERFISAARGEPPDIDVDFEHERREEVIQYIYKRYGRDRAGLAATVICYRARGAIREVGKALGLSADIVAALAGMVWGWSSEKLRDERVREAGLDPEDPTLRLALDLAGELIGFPRHLSQHVGGFVVTRGPLSELVPIENAAMADRTVIEWDKDDLDALGILKIDILALGMLTCVRKAFGLIERHYGKSYDLARVPAERPEVYEMLSRADSVGVFQVESRAQMTMLPRLKPKEFYDLVIEVAIVRPGPIQGDMVHPYLRRRSGKEKVEYPSLELERVLKKTMGVPLFQEQAMKIAIVGAGFPPDEADRLRRAMATFKRNGEIHLFRDRFLAGMLKNGYTAEFATRCFDQIEGFGTYGFPESHAASFALLVYVSAWIKCCYPDVFACALLNAQPMGFYAPAQIVRDAREHGVEIRPPDINHSDWDCTLEPCVSSLAQRGRGTMRPPDLIRGMGEEADAGAPSVSLREPPPPQCGGGTAIDPPPWSGGGGPCAAWWRGRPEHALRLGLRQVKGLAEADAKRLVERRGDGYRDAEELWRRSGLGRAVLDRLAAADAMRSLGLDRRRGLWALKALGEPPLPLFAAEGRLHLQPASFETRPADAQDEAGYLDGIKQAPHPGSLTEKWFERPQPAFPAKAGTHPATARPPERWVPACAGTAIGGASGVPAHFESGSEEAAKRPSRRTHSADPAEKTEAFAASLLPAMPLGEHVVEDYATIGLTIKRHPLAFLRAELRRERLVTAADLAILPVDRRVAIAGLVLIRQRPGSANGVVFVTLEDETGIANLIVWPATLERFRCAALGATLLYCRGKLQREEGVIHVVAEDLRDWTPRLLTLRQHTGDEVPIPRAPAPALRRPPGELRALLVASRDFR